MVWVFFVNFLIFGHFGARGFGDCQTKASGCTVIHYDIYVLLLIPFLIVALDAPFGQLICIELK